MFLALVACSAPLDASSTGAASDPPVADSAEPLPGDSAELDSGDTAPEVDPGPYTFSLVATGFGSAGRLLYVRAVDAGDGTVAVDGAVREQQDVTAHAWPEALSAGRRYVVSVFYDRNEDAVCDVRETASPDLGWVAETEVATASVSLFLASTDAPDLEACDAWPGSGVR